MLLEDATACLCSVVPLCNQLPQILGLNPDFDQGYSWVFPGSPEFIKGKPEDLTVYTLNSGHFQHLVCDYTPCYYTALKEAVQARLLLTRSGDPSSSARIVERL